MKNKIQLSESEKKEILYQHYQNSFGWIMEDLTSSTVNNQVEDPIPTGDQGYKQYVDQLLTQLPPNIQQLIQNNPDLAKVIQNNPALIISLSQQLGPQQSGQQPQAGGERWREIAKTQQIKGVQARCNDTCPQGVLNAVLEKYPKGRTGTTPNYKLKEDNINGPATLAAAKACKTEWDAGRFNTQNLAQNQNQNQNQLQQNINFGPKIGEPLTANDIATLVA